LTVAQVRNVATSWTDVDFTLYIDEFRERYLKQMVNYLAASVSLDVMSLANQVPNFVSNVNSSGNIIAPIQQTWLNAGVLLDNLSADRMDRQATLSPQTQGRTVAGLAGLFNPTTAIADQYRKGVMTGTMAFGIDGWRLDQTVISHTTGTGTSMSVNGSGTFPGNVLPVTCTGTILAGDRITIAAVNSVNRLTGQDNGTLAQFVVLVGTSGSGNITVFPAIVPNAGSPVQYQTVDVAPQPSAVINFVSKPSEVYRQNLVYKPEAFALVTADLPLIKNGVVASSRDRYDGISMRYVRGYEILTATYVDRLDILYGYAMPKQDWSVIVADSLT
jgi:hypothetical protein